MASHTSRRARPLATVIDALQARGRYVISHAELRALGKRSGVALQAALRRLRTSSRIASPRRGFHVIVPVEYRAAGCPPPSWFIDDLMRHLGQPYYVGLLSAAALHGAAHQQPMAFQVITDRATRPMRAGRVRIEFCAKRALKTTPVQLVQTETGTMRVSTPEATCFDLVRFASAAGHLSNVATVLAELAGRLDAEKLVALAATQPTPDVQRLGHLLERVHARSLAERLERSLATRRTRPVLLASKAPRRRRRPDARWQVIPNAEVEPDL